ncbi:MAG: hypothetical protein JWR83_1265 [Aeromicrobium sp.]|nr:hypothetical protein [Aeromicrobium sp.]
MTLHHLHRRALEIATDFVDAVGPADLGRSTPCAEWHLAALLEHMIGQNHGFAEAIAGVEVTVESFAPRTFGDLGSAWALSAEILVDAVAASSSQSIFLPEISADRRFGLDTVVGFHHLDTVVHTWDVATALGLAWRPTPRAAAEVLAAAQRVPAGEGRLAPGAAFAPSRPADTGDPWIDALALVGRTS